MAQVKPFKFDSDGFPIELDDALDDLTINSLTVDSGIDMGSSSITNLAAGSAATDAVNKGQLDAVANGFDPKASCRVKHTTAADYTATGSGVGKTLEAATSSSAENTVDGVLLSVNDRVLVDDETADSDNGIYYVSQLGDDASAKFTLTRATDADQDAEVTAGMYVFVTEGNSYADTGWYVVTNDPITVDTTAIEFTQFAGVGTYTGGNGIDITSGVISVDLATNPGLEFSTGQLTAKVDTASGLQLAAAGIQINLEADGAIVFDGVNGGLEINLEASNPTLEINGSNELAVKYSSTASGLDQDANGLKVKVDSTTIGINGSGQIYVIGGGTVDQYTLTAGTGGVTIGDPVYVSANDTGLPCDNANNNTRKYVGVAAETASAGNPFLVQQEGVVTPASIGGSPAAGDVVWLDTTSGVTVTLPTGSGTHRMVVGKMKNATQMIIEPQYIAKLD